MHHVDPDSLEDDTDALMVEQLHYAAWMLPSAALDDESKAELQECIVGTAFERAYEILASVAIGQRMPAKFWEMLVQVAASQACYERAREFRQLAIAADREGNASSSKKS